MRFAIVPALALALLAAACGFKPLYAPSPSGAPAIGPVIVDEMPGRSGFELKAALDRLFDAERGTGAARRLAVTISESTAGLGFRVDESASRADLVLSANYVLYDVSGAEVIKGSASGAASYDIPASAYGEIAAQDDARARAADQLAERIRAELALKLASRPLAPAP